MPPLVKNKQTDNTLCLIIRKVHENEIMLGVPPYGWFGTENS